MTFREFDLMITRELKWFASTFCIVPLAVLAVTFLASGTLAGNYLGEGLTTTSSRILDQLAIVLERS